MASRVNNNTNNLHSRRSFLEKSAAGAGALLTSSQFTGNAYSSSGNAVSQTAAGAKEKIKEVRAYTFPRNVSQQNTESHRQNVWTVTNLIAAPMSVYPEYHDSRISWGIDNPGGMIVEVEDAAGRIGVGLSSCGIPGAYIVEQHFKRFLIDEHPQSIEKIWDQMWRSSMHYGRKGLAIMAISAVDLALWDLLGLQRQEPVYAMIGGLVKDEIHMYATTPNPAYAKQMGFWGAKMALPHGPADGREGLMANVRMAEKARNAVGDDFDLMFDCWMALDVPYTIELARELEQYRIKWLEEFLPPDDYDGLADVRAAVQSCWLTAGEHEFTRYGFLELLKRKSLNIVQPDLSWCGGLSEAMKIADIAKAYGVHVVPHVSSMYSYHFVMTQTNAPFAEFIILGPKGDKIVPVFGGTFKDEPLPVNGKMRLSDKPGWGLTLDRENLTLERPFG